MPHEPSPNSVCSERCIIGLLSILFKYFITGLHYKKHRSWEYFATILLKTENHPLLEMQIFNLVKSRQSQIDIFSQIFGCIAMVVSICNLQLNISYPRINNIFTDLCLLTVFIQHNKINCNLLYFFFFYKTFYKYFYKMYTKQFQVRHTLQMKVFKQIKSIPHWQ